MEPTSLNVTNVIFAGVLALPIYLLPAIVAFFREHRNKWAVFVLNLFLGWTFAFWVLALVWAVIKVPTLHFVATPEPPASRRGSEGRSAGADS